MGSDPVDDERNRIVVIFCRPLSRVWRRGAFSAPAASRLRNGHHASPPTFLWAYASVIFVMCNLMVMGYEEPALESQFGQSVRAYERAVPRWGFTKPR